jgi:radical SAM superfamily enzyme YgiQ (UPF0313 family)
MTIKKVTFIGPQLPYWNFVSHCLFPEYGMPLVATIVRDHGYDVRMFVETIGPIDWKVVFESDLVCFHTFSSTMPRTVEYIQRVKAARPDMRIVIGGTHASTMVEDTLQYCDVVVRQEGDETLPDLLAAWNEGRHLSTVPGIAYWDHGRMCRNPDRPYVEAFETIPDLSLIDGYQSWSRLKLMRHGRLRMQVLQTSRGCPYDCSFCIAPRELGRSYRLRSIDSVIADIKYQMQFAGARRFFIVDNHFTVNRPRAKELLNRIIAEQIDWSAICFTRLEVSQDDELLDLLKKANINTLYLGLESFDNRVLKWLNKKQTGDHVRKALRNIKSHGLRPLGSFVLGSDEDTVETVRCTLDACVEEDLDWMVLFPLSGYPEHNSRTIPLRRFLLPTWDRLDGTFVIFFPKNMKPSTLQREMNRGYSKFYSFKQVWRRIRNGDWGGAVSRMAYSYWAWEVRRSTEKWAQYLETVEGPYYDKNERLIEEKLPPEGIHPAKYPGNQHHSEVALPRRLHEARLIQEPHGTFATVR